MSELFRKKSLDKLSSPEQLDKMIVVSSPMTWFALLGGFLIIIVVLIWGITGRIPVTEDGMGILLGDGVITSSYAGTQGVITKVFVKGGDKVEAGDALCEVKSVDEQGDVEDLEICTETSGVVYSTLVTVGCSVTEYTEVARINSQTDDTKMNAIYYFTLASGKNIKKGMKINIYPTNYPKEEYGHMTGTVTSVAEYVTSHADLYSALGDETLVESFASAGPVIEVRCNIEPDSSTVSGFAWSSQKGERAELQVATPLTGSVITEEVPPITKLIPKLKEMMKIE